MTLLQVVQQVVQQAVNQCNSLAPGDVVKQLILTGYNPTPVNDVFRALETIQNGVQHDSNNKNAFQLLKLTHDADPIQEATVRNARQKEKNQRKKDAGICISCSTEAKQGHIYCERCLARERINSRRWYANNGHKAKKVKEVN